LLINYAFVDQKNFDIIEMHGATTKINDWPVVCAPEISYEITYLLSISSE
jgi:hypothetical protein